MTYKTKTHQWISEPCPKSEQQGSGHNLFGRLFESGRPPGICSVSSSHIMQAETIFAVVITTFSSELASEPGGRDARRFFGCLPDVANTLI